MQTVEAGDRVRIDIPDETDSDHHYHAEHGVIVAVTRDDAGTSTGDGRDSYLYRVQLASGQEVDFRWRDLRPPLE